MIARLNPAKIKEIWRYYQVGILNTVFGFSLYSALVALGLNIYVAQFLAHFAGVAFNYFSYSRHVFTGSAPAKIRFIFSYIGNYLFSLLVLAGVKHVVESAYLAGFISVVIVSLINYFVLKSLVFNRNLA